MNERDFVYWLQGFMEMVNPKTLTEEQVKMIKDHLQLVFEKKTTSHTIPVLPIDRDHEKLVDDLVEKARKSKDLKRAMKTYTEMSYPPGCTVKYC